MFVYVVMGHIAYEGENLLAVTLNEQEALAIAQEECKYYETTEVIKWNVETNIPDNTYEKTFYRPALSV